jgi:hypothetical protein
MKRKRHTEEQIIAILKEHEAGMKTGPTRSQHRAPLAASTNERHENVAATARRSALISEAPRSDCLSEQPRRQTPESERGR